MKQIIKEAIEKLKSISKTKPIKVISHNDTDGITSAAILSKALKRANISFSLEIIKNLEKSFIKQLSEKQVLVFLDLGSGSLETLKKKNTEIFILDHHEIPGSPRPEEIPKNITLINPILYNEENITSSAICYLFAKQISETNKDLASLAIIGVIGDNHEKNINKVYEEIRKDSEIIIKRGLLLYPATRPLDRVLENSYSLYIPGVTGSYGEVIKLLRDANIPKTHRGFKTIAELTDNEMSNLATAIMLKKIGQKNPKEILGNIYLVKFLNRQEDARELSAKINACSKMGYPEISLGLCLGNKTMKSEAEKIYFQYKRTISSALSKISEIEKISGKDYLIINAKDKIKDTIVGTIASIMSFSPLYSEGTVIITMSNSISGSNIKKIKVSARLAGRNGRNVRRILEKATSSIPEEELEIGGHPSAAGCLIPLKKEAEFLQNLKKTLEIELVKV